VSTAYYKQDTVLVFFTREFSLFYVKLRVQAVRQAILSRTDNEADPCCFKSLHEQRPYPPPENRNVVNNIIQPKIRET